MNWNEEEIYLAIDTWGYCQVCGQNDDLRYGVCFNCSDHVVVDDELNCRCLRTGKTWNVKEIYGGEQ